jgi:predicted deoxyguanosinetriphosphate triphosphohydrolase
MDWPRLLSPRRFPDGSSQTYIRARPPWQQDYDRLVFCSAFRRLQDKTQVHPLSGSDYVRTRLTHSLEVSSVARSLGTLAGNHILEKHGKKKYQQTTLSKSLTPLDVGMIASAAALAHDIGNPPFGHSGEDAIRYWFATSPVAAKVKAKLSDVHVHDLETWEGNAEGFRLLVRLQMSRNNWGMRLTSATLGSFMKYPLSSKAFSEDRNRAKETKSKQEVARKKPGLFRHDLELWLLQFRRQRQRRAFHRSPGSSARIVRIFICHRKNTKVGGALHPLDSGRLLRTPLPGESVRLGMPVSNQDPGIEHDVHTDRYRASGRHQPVPRALRPI